MSIGKMGSDEYRKNMSAIGKRRGYGKWMKGKNRESFRGAGNPNYKGGRRVDGCGYVAILSRNHPNKNAEGYVREHRLVIEAKIGRYLTRLEHVHHINGNKTDNRLENLIAFKSNSAHRKFEMLGVVSSDHILFDGRAV